MISALDAEILPAAMMPHSCRHRIPRRGGRTALAALLALATSCGALTAADAGVNPTFTITASAGSGGSITPSGAVVVATGTDTTFTIAADPCDSVADVLVD